MEYAPFLLSEQEYTREKVFKNNQQDYEFPDDCIVDFDMRLIDLFKEMSKIGLKKQELIKEEYYRIKEFLDDKVPSRLELFTYMTDDIYQICIGASKNNPFNNYLDFLYDLHELNSEEDNMIQGLGKEFLHTLETTSMQKSYKMPILLAFYNNGSIKMGITEEDVHHSYKNFYSKGINWKDLEKDKSSRDYQKWDMKKYVSEAKKNPIHFLKESGKGFFVDHKGYVLGLNEQLQKVIQLQAFKKHMIDIIEYRVMDYYRKRYRKEEDK